MNKIKGNTLFIKIKFIPMVLVFTQVLLGIVTLLTSRGIIPGRWGYFEWVAQLHQLTGMLLLLSIVLLLFVVRKKASPL